MNKRWGWILVMLVVVLGVGATARWRRVRASEVTISSFGDLMKGKFFGSEGTSNPGAIKIKDSGAWVGRAWTTPNMTLGDQAAIGTDGKDLYLLANGTVEMSRYLVAENRWENLKEAPETAYAGAGMIWQDGYFYVIFGGYQREFYRYSPNLNEWEELSMLPDLVANGAQIISDGTSLYVIKGGGANDFWKYNPITNAWNSMDTPPAVIGAGSGAVYDEGAIYVLRGGNTNTFYKYTVNLGLWTTLAVAPATFNEDHQITTDGDYIYVSRDQNTQSFYRYQISNNTWTSLANTPIVSRYVGSIYVAGDDKVYVFRGNNSYDFWKYDPDNNVFLGVPDLPNTPGTGSDLVIKNNTIYYLRGNGSQNFYQFSLGATGVGATWVTLQNTPATIADDTKMVGAGDFIYAFRGSGTNTMYKYDLTQGIGTTWAVGATAPATVNYGASLVYPGSGDFVYGTRGGFSRSFWRMTISGVGESWNDGVVADLPDNAEVGYGSRMVSDGSDIYLITGNTISRLFKYNIVGDSWTAVTDLPFSPFYGTDMTYYGGKIYFQTGNYKTDVWEYTISANSFRRLADLGTAYGTLLGPYNGGSLEVDGGGNLYSTSGQGLNWIQKYTIDSNRYLSSGSYESEVLDLVRVASFESLNISSTIPEGGQVIVNTRTSQNRLSWSDWSLSVGGSISSQAFRFLQIGVTLIANNDRSQSPVLTAVSVNYNQSSDTPSAPNSFQAWSKRAGGTVLSSGGTYPYISPYFSWSGAGDSDGIEGYYVYFGDNEAADPAVEGNFQNESGYQVGRAMSTGVYYLRIKARDEAGIVSPGVTGFVYVYNGISPPSEIMVDLNSEFGLGSTEKMSIENDGLKLAAKAGFFTDERLSYTPILAYNGADMAYVESSGKLYVEFGNNSNRFYEYNVSLDLWTSLANSPAGFNAGGALVAGPTGYIYALRGNNTKNFWRYEISSNTWSDAAVAETPQEIYYGASMVYDGGRYIYVLKGNGDDTFLSYDTEADVWTTLTNVDFGQPYYQVNNMVSYGGNLAMDIRDGKIYAIQGNTRSGFSVYDVANQSWSRLPNLPALAYYGARIEFDAEDREIYYLPGWDKDYWYKYKIDDQVWEKLTNAPAVISYGAAMRLVGDEMIVMRGANTNSMYKYDIEKDSWFLPNVGLFGTWYRGTNSRAFGPGAEIVKGDANNYYISRGNWDNSFVRYNSLTGEISRLSDAPAGFYNGSEMAYDSVRNKLFVSGSTYYNRLFSYDIASDIWSEAVGISMPTDSGNGTALAFDGGDNLYRLRGDGTTNFDKYNIVSGVWSTLPAAPGALGLGADMVIKNDYAYVVRGNGTTAFYRYGPLSVGATWSASALRTLPAGQTIGQDGFLVDIGGDKLMACRGINTTTCFTYSISDNLWSTMPAAPANIYQGGAGASNGAEEMFFIAGSGGTNTYTMGLYKYVIGSSASSFEESGSWTSPAYDLGSIYRFSGIEVGYSGANNASLQLFTRTSDDGLSWDDWIESDEVKTVGTTKTYLVESETERYIQTKIVLRSGDGVYSGKIDYVKLSYYTDEDLPTNPQIFGSLSVGGSELVSNHWGNSSAPYFDWPGVGESGGASDVGSGVIGYYVYFGRGETAAPEVLGTYTTGTQFVGTGLTLGQTYYFRLKTVDDAGNLSSDVGNTFVYKFDNEAPSNPLAVLADPPGYTTQTEFKFTWGSGSDTYSGVAEYCYKTGASEGVWASDQCVSAVGTTGVAGVPKYQSDENIFYIRTKDVAGNYASSYQTAVYKYSGSAPSKPQNLRITYPLEGSSNTENDFAFAWDVPENYLGSSANIVYYYSINEVPTPSNVVRLGAGIRYLSRDSYATWDGINTLYVIASDEAGNIKEENGKYTNFASIDFTAATSAPGVPLNLDISDVSIKETKSWRLALSWDAPEASGSGIDKYRIYRMESEGADCVAEGIEKDDYVAETSQTSYVDTGLTQTKKYYCVRSCNSTKQCSAVSETVSLLPDGRWRVAPSLASEPEAVVKTKSAVISWSTSRKANSFVKYGKNSGEYGEEVGNSDLLSAHVITLTGLDPGTTYYYKVLWTDEDGNGGESEEYSLVTNPAPFVSTVKISDVGLFSAYVNFKLANATKARVEYGITTAYGGVNEITTSTIESIYMLKVDNLTEGTKYHVRISAEDEEGNVFRSDDYEFETLPVPKVSEIKILQIKGAATATVRVSWKSNTGISSIVSYYPKNNPEKVKDSIQLTMTKNHQLIISDLKDDADYVFVIKGRDVGGNEAKSTIQNFKTSNDLRSPLIDDLRVEAVVSGVGDQAKAQIVINWKTDEPASGQIEYGEGSGGDYPYKTQENTALLSDHVITIPDLKPGNVYHLRVITKDGVGNKTESFDSVVVTSKATKSALDLVVNSLSKSFGFFNSLSGFGTTK